MNIDAKEKESYHTEEEYEAYPPDYTGRTSGFVGMLLTVAYAVYAVIYFSDASSQSVISSILIANMVGPHILCVVVAAVFAVIGFFGWHRWAILTASILMCVSGALFVMYAKFVVIQAVALIVSYIRLPLNQYYE